MIPRRASLTTLWLSTLLVVLLSLTSGTSALSVTATRPKPIVLTTAKPPSPATKPKTSKPDKPDGPDVPDLPDLSGGGGGGGSTTTTTNGYVFLPCTDMEKWLVMNPTNYDVQQCMAFSTYNFASGFIPTTMQKSLLCDTGCWDLINRLLVTPIPYCSVVIGGRAVNYIDALYTIFANCASPDQTQEQAVASPSNAPATPPATTPSSGSTVWRTRVLALTVSALALAAML